MDFDFYTSFAGKSNEELLQVILQKELYQPAAVEAAEKILASRNVTEEEKAVIRNGLEVKAVAQQERREKNEKLKTDAGKLIYSVVFPAQRTPVYFIRFFAIAFLAIWIYSILPIFTDYSSVWSDSPTWVTFITLIELATLLMIYWLFRLQKKGWVMLLIYFTFSAGSALYFILIYEPPAFWPNFKPDNSPHYFRLFISGLVFYYFNRKDVLETLQITRLFQIRLILYCIIPLAVLYLLYAISGFDLSYYFS
jgi:hypothetical protein